MQVSRGISRKVLLLLFAAFSHAQEIYAEDGGYGGYNDQGGYGENYQDYADPYGQDDNLYADYAARQEMKESGGGGYVLLLLTRFSEVYG